MNSLHNDNYDDILRLPHHVSDRHLPMSVTDRAAQFAPFAALTGYGEIIDDARKQNADKDDTVIFTADDIDIP